MIRTKNRMRLCITLLTLNLVFIWGNSLLPGSISGAISDWFKGILAALLPVTEAPVSGGFLLRKLGHFTEFAALGMCLGWLCAMLRRGRTLPFFLGTAAAGLDETIQRFVPDRGPGLRDVCIDACGVLAGLLLLYGAHALYRKTRHNLEETKT